MCGDYGFVTLLDLRGEGDRACHERPRRPSLVGHQLVRAAVVVARVVAP